MEPETARRFHWLSSELRGEGLNLTEENRKRAEFSQLLKDLAMAQNPSSHDQSQFFKRLESLYHTPGEEKNFRHFYSDILSVLIEIKENDPMSGSSEYLLLNLDGLRQNYIPNKNSDTTGAPIDIQDYIRKLYDHVNLEAQRMRYSDNQDYKLSQQKAIQQLSDQVTKAANAIKNTELAQAEVEKKLENSQKEYIAILGIFAAIVLAFTGGMAFSSSVLEYMHTVSVYRILLVTLVLGLVLFNVIYLLVWYINRIVRGYVKMESIIWLRTQLVIGVLIVLVVLGWWFGAVEKRDNHLSSFDRGNSVIEIVSPEFE